MAADQWSVVYIKTPVTGDWTQAIYTKLTDNGKKSRQTVRNPYAEKLTTLSETWN